MSINALVDWYCPKQYSKRINNYFGMKGVLVESTTAAVDLAATADLA